MERNSSPARPHFFPQVQNFYHKCVLEFYGLCTGKVSDLQNNESLYIPSPICTRNACMYQSNERKQKKKKKKKRVNQGICTQWHNDNSNIQQSPSIGTFLASSSLPYVRKSSLSIVENLNPIPLVWRVTETFAHRDSYMF